MKQSLPILDLNVDQEAFIREQSIVWLRTLQPTDRPLWGMMTPQHMIEHLIFIYENSLGERAVNLLIEEEKLPKYLSFLRSNYGFSQNFKFGMIPENELVPLKYGSIDLAIKALEQKIHSFFELINADYLQYTLHPYYGKLNRVDSILFQFKHTMHHLMQFGWVS
ncbi:MAG: hypothetical protein R2730_04795 [Chitinophagales bacterium]